MTEQRHEMLPGEIDDAVEAFESAASALALAPRETWMSRLRALVHLGRTNRVLLLVLQPLRDAEVRTLAWWQARTSGSTWAIHGGSSPLELPAEPERAAALMLQLLEAFVDNNVSFENALLGIIGVRHKVDFDVRARRMADALLSPLRPYVAAQLRVLRRAASPEPPRGAATINFQGPVVAPFGSVTGGTFAVGDEPSHLSQVPSQSSTGRVMIDESRSSFSIHDIREATASFDAAVRAIGSASQHNWDRRMRALLATCRTDPVLQAASRPLLSADAGVEAWWARHAGKTAGGTFGAHGTPDFPTADPTQLAAFCFQLLAHFEEKRIEFFRAALPIVGIYDNDLDQSARELSAVLVEPIRSVIGRELRAMERAATPPTRSAPAVQISNPRGPVIAPAGSIDGGNWVFGDNNSVVQSTTSYHAVSDVGRELQGWLNDLADVPSSEREAVAGAVTTLARTADGADISSGELVHAAETVVRASPTLRSSATAFVRSLPAAVALGAAAEIGAAAVHAEKVRHALDFVLRLIGVS